MAYWLLKTDPDTYRFADLARAGRTRWDGVANPLALSHMRKVQPGDQVLVYHTGKDKCVVGPATIVSAAYPDPADRTGQTVVFDLEASRTLARRVTLAEIKADPRFADFALVRMPRLSVMPVPAPLWKRLLDLENA